MDLKNRAQEVKAEFDAILGKVMRHRGKHRTKYLADLKAFMVNVLERKTHINDKHKILEIGNLQLENRNLQLENRNLESEICKLRKENEELEKMWHYCYNRDHISKQKLAEELKQKQESNDKLKKLNAILNS